MSDYIIVTNETVTNVTEEVVPDVTEENVASFDTTTTDYAHNDPIITMDYNLDQSDLSPG